MRGWHTHEVRLGSVCSRLYNMSNAYQIRRCHPRRASRTHTAPSWSWRTVSTHFLRKKGDIHRACNIHIHHHWVKEEARVIPVCAGTQMVTRWCYSSIIASLLCIMIWISDDPAVSIRFKWLFPLTVSVYWCVHAVHSLILTGCRW